MPVSTPVPDNDPLMIAWKAYQETDEYASTKKWYGNSSQSAEGSMWASFMAGFHARPPVDSVAVDIMVRVKAECTKHQKGVGATGCNSCPLAGEGFNCVLDGPASHWDMPAMEAALSDSTGEG